MVQVWGYAEGAKEWRLEATLSGHSDWVRDAAWAPNVGLPMSTIASCGQDGKVLVWTQSVRTPPPRHVPRVSRGATTSPTLVLQISEWREQKTGSRPWLSLTRQGAAQEEGAAWESTVLVELQVPVWRVSWSVTGNLLAVSDGNHEVTLWKEQLDGSWTQIQSVQ